MSLLQQADSALAQLSAFQPPWGPEHIVLRSWAHTFFMVSDYSMLQAHTPLQG